MLVSAYMHDAMLGKEIDWVGTTRPDWYDVSCGIVLLRSISVSSRSGVKMNLTAETAVASSNIHEAASVREPSTL